MAPHRRSPTWCTVVPKPIRPGSVLLLLCVIAYLFYLGHSFAVRRFVETVRAVLAAIPTHLYGG